MDAQVIVRCINVHKSFTVERPTDPALHVLRGIDLDVRRGECLSIVGASGSGKSTLLHILGGLDRPSVGEVYWLGKNITSMSDETLARLRGSTVGFVFQFHHLLPEFTALENVMIPVMIQGGSQNAAANRATVLLETVGLHDRLHHKPGALSGGEQQRVAVARALVNGPQIVFADEPSGNLDSTNSEQLHALLLRLNRDEGQTFVIVTHNEQLAGQSDRILRMVDGKLQPLEARSGGDAQL